MGCARKCSVLAESMQDSHFMIGRDDAIYCYTPDGRGPCYAAGGQKNHVRVVQKLPSYYSKRSCE